MPASLHGGSSRRELGSDVLVFDQSISHVDITGFTLLAARVYNIPHPSARYSICCSKMHFIAGLVGSNTQIVSYLLVDTINGQ